MVEQGTIVRVDYEAYTDDGELFDTTKRDVAEEHDHVHEDAPYQPMPIIVGAGRVVPGFDEALLEADVGQEGEVEIPPEKAFGERDASKVTTVSMREFEKQDVHPHPGMRVQLQERRGTVVAVTAGRVRVDFNPPLAGKTLTYKYEVMEELTDPVDQIRALIDLDYGAGRGEDFDIAVEESVATLTLPDRCKYDQRWIMAKYRLVADLRQYSDVKTIHLVEEYVSDEERAGPDADAGDEDAADAGAESPDATEETDAAEAAANQ